MPYKKRIVIFVHVILTHLAKEMESRQVLGPPGYMYSMLYKAGIVLVPFVCTCVCVFVALKLNITLISDRLTYL